MRETFALHVCELNSKNKISNPRKFILDQNSNYYEPILPVSKVTSNISFEIVRDLSRIFVIVFENFKAILSRRNSPHNLRNSQFISFYEIAYSCFVHFGVQGLKSLTQVYHWYKSVFTAQNFCA